MNYETILLEITTILTANFAIIGFIDISIILSPLIFMLFDIVYFNQKRFFQQSCCRCSSLKE
jgi:hypothetical protein